MPHRAPGASGIFSEVIFVISYLENCRVRSFHQFLRNFLKMTSNWVTLFIRSTLNVYRCNNHHQWQQVNFSLIFKRNLKISLKRVTRAFANDIFKIDDLKKTANEVSLIFLGFSEIFPKMMPKLAPRAPGIPGRLGRCHNCNWLPWNPRGRSFDQIFIDFQKMFPKTMPGTGNPPSGIPSVFFNDMFVIICLKNLRVRNFERFSKMMPSSSGNQVYLGPFPMSYSWLSTWKTPENKFSNDFCSIFKNTLEDYTESSSPGTRYTWDLRRCHIRDWLPGKPPRTNFWKIFIRF